MSAPIHLIQWGSIEDESDDVEEIKALLEDKYKVNQLVFGERIHAADRFQFLSKLKMHLECPKLQILYIACHGNLDGIVYDVNGTQQISFDEFFEAMKSSSRNVEKPIVLIFGFCHAMDKEIERYAPEWVTEIAGFKNAPSNLDVCDLGAGVIADINDYGFTLLGVMKKGWRKGVKPEDLPSIMIGFAERAHSQHIKRPERFLRTNKENVVISSRSDDGTWKREGV